MDKVCFFKDTRLQSCIYEISYRSCVFRQILNRYHVSINIPDCSHVSTNVYDHPVIYHTFYKIILLSLNDTFSKK